MSDPLILALVILWCLLAPLLLAPEPTHRED